MASGMSETYQRGLNIDPEFRRKAVLEAGWLAVVLVVVFKCFGPVGYLFAHAPAASMSG